MILKPIGCIFNSASLIFETFVLFDIAWAIYNRYLFCSSQTRQTLTTFIP